MFSNKLYWTFKWKVSFLWLWSQVTWGRYLIKINTLLASQKQGVNCFGIAWGWLTRMSRSGNGSRCSWAWEHTWYGWLKTKLMAFSRKCGFLQSLYFLEGVKERISFSFQKRLVRRSLDHTQKQGWKMDPPCTHYIASVITSVWLVCICFSALHLLNQNVVKQILYYLPT